MPGRILLYSCVLIAVLAVIPVSADEPPLFTIPDVATVLSVEDARQLGQYQIAGLDSPTYGPLHIPSLLLPKGNASASPAYELLYFNNVVPSAADTLELSFALRGVPYTAELSKIPVELGQGMTGYTGHLREPASARVSATLRGPHTLSMTIHLPGEQITLDTIQSEAALKTTKHPLHIAYSSKSFPDLSGSAGTGDKPEPVPAELRPTQSSENSTGTVPQQTPAGNGNGIPLITIPNAAAILSDEEVQKLAQYQIAGIDSPTYGRLHVPPLLLSTNTSPAYELLYFENVVPDAADTLGLSLVLRGVSYTAELSKIPVDPGQGKTGYNGSLRGLESAKVNAAVLGPHIISMVIELPDERIIIETVQSGTALKTTQHPLHIAYSSKSLPDSFGYAGTGDNPKPHTQQASAPEMTKAAAPLAEFFGIFGVSTLLFCWRRNKV